MAKHDIELYGRKTFFIAPDTSLIPKTYLEEFLGRGFETYIINDDYTCPLQTKIREITKLYPEAILYFNIDSSVEGIEWKNYIRELQEFMGESILIGIFYLKRQNSDEEEKIKSYFMRDIGIRAGCFALAQRDQNNFDSILAALEKSGAKGRRNLVRANCDTESSVNFKHNGTAYTANLLDVNVTHFRCDLQGDSESFAIFEKVRDVSLQINGMSFLSDAVLIMKRNYDGKNLCVFMFIKHDDTPDLEKETEKKLNQKIYQIVLNDNMNKLSEAFKSA